MAARPKKDDSRDKQYRIRLNEVEEAMLNYSSEATGVRKSEIFRQALYDYYQKVRLQQFSEENEENEETNDDDDEDIDPAYADFDEYGRINLKRIFGCPICTEGHKIDLKDVSTVTTNERQLGVETRYEFNTRYVCKGCGQPLTVTGHIVEYPAGVLNDESYSILLKGDDDDKDGTSKGPGITLTRVL